MNETNAARLRKIINIFFLCVFILSAIAKYVIRNNWDLKLFPELMFYFAYVVQPLFLLSLGAVIVPIIRLLRLQWNTPWCKYLAIFSFIFAFGGSLCMIIFLAKFPEGGIMSMIGSRLFSTHKNWLVVLGLSWSLSINICLGRDK